MSSSSSNVDTSSAAVMSLDDYFQSIEEYVESNYIPIEEIESATNNLADENLLKQTPYAKTYKGRLMQSSGEFINILARICMQHETVYNELLRLKDLRHKHIVPILKLSFTDDDDDDTIIAIINKHEANESLDKHLSTLSWMQRLHICVGIADALKYLHYDAEENHSVIHGNIKTSKILLDHHWEPKLHGFGFAVRAKRNQLYLTDKYKGSLQYMDPAYENTRGLTHKSDVFSFGVVLFEVLFGRDASSVLSTPDHKDSLCFARLARVHYEEKTLDDMIDPDLREQMNLESLNIFSETAYFCLKEQQSDRPDMKKVLQRLKGALELQRKHESPEHSTAGEGTSSNHLKVKTLDHLKFRLSDIKLATNNFSDTYCIGSGGFAIVYKAELDHFDGKSATTMIKGEKKVELPKRCSTVAIKRIFGRVDGQAEKGFLSEIELLSRCKHANIVSLIGFCNEEPEMILIYEYATNGSLEAYLGDNDKIANLTWAKRIKISIGIAHGLHYLHKSTEDKECIIHRDIKSANILLDDKWEAKIADFGLSKLHPTYNQRSTLITGNIGGTQVYLDPEYEKTGSLKTSSDIYSFGIVLCEIMTGNLAYDHIYNTMALPSIVRQCFNDETIEELLDPQIKEAGENTYGLNDSPSHDSLYTFSKIASQCVAEAQAHRPTMEVIIKELEKSLNLQNNRKDNLQISLEAIKLGTQNFSDCNCIGKRRFWRRYEGEISLANANGRTPIVAKRFDSGSDEGNSQFMTELKILFERKHKNIVGLVGYCNEKGEKIIVYEHASNGTLDKHLDNANNLTWMKRLKIGLDVARGLEYLHTGGITHDTPMIHRDIKSSSILLDGDWRAKLSNLEVSTNAYAYKEIEHVDDNAYGSLSYVDPKYKDQRGYLIRGSDTCSLGVVLLEMLLGRLSWAEGHSDSLVRLAKRWYKKDTLGERIFEGIKEQIGPRSLDAYSAITFECLNYYDPPDASRLVEKLTLALAYQEDHEVWEPRLPKDYEKLCEMSKTKFEFRDNEIFDRLTDEPERIKHFYDLLCKGFLFQEGKAWFSLGSKEKRNVMISGRKFSYANRWLRKWQSIPKSRFQVAAQMLDISNLKIQIKIKPQLLLPGKNYGVYLVFKFREPGKNLAKRMYVNLKYKRGSDNLRADFATWREDGWMMIELCQILNYEEDTEFEVLLESFSRIYCGSSVYIEGIEFRALENEYEQDESGEIEDYEETQKYEDIKQIKEVRQVLKSCSNMDKGFLLKKVQNEKICFIISEMEVPNNSSKAKPFHLKYSAESRFQGEIELSKRQVFGIKGKIESQMLSPDTDYMCYLVFKLSEKCHGLHCQVKVRNVLQWKNKEIGLICFRPPSPWNLPDTKTSPNNDLTSSSLLPLTFLLFLFNYFRLIISNYFQKPTSSPPHLVSTSSPSRRRATTNPEEEPRKRWRRTRWQGSNGAPKERADGWMEVLVWKFNSNSELRNNHIPMNLKFITYEGTMSGLTVSGLEIRPM